MPSLFATAPRWRPAALLLLVLTCAAAPLVAQPASERLPASDVHTRLQSTTVLGARSFQSGPQVRRDHTPVQTRLQVLHRPPGATVTASVAARWAFDPGLPDTPVDDRLAEWQLEPTLEHAWLMWQPLPALRLQAGRITMTSPLGLVRLDGLAWAVPLPRATFLRGGLGLRPSQVRAQINAPDVGPEGDEQFRVRPWKDPLVIELHGGWDDRLGAISMAARLEHAADASTLYSAPLGLQGRLGDAAGLHLAGSVRWEPVQAHLARLVLAGTAPAGAQRRLHAALRYERPLFPLDDLFSVFAASANATAALGAGDQHGAWRIDAEAQLRATAVDEVSTPLGQDGDLRGGGDVRVAWRPTASRVSTTTVLEADRGHAGWHGRVRQTGTWAPRRGPTWHASALAVASRDDRSLRNQQLRAGFLALGTAATLGRFADLQIQSTFGLDRAQGATVSVMAMADLHLVRRAR